LFFLEMELVVEDKATFMERHGKWARKKCGIG
jgi:hypothetical protein